MFEVRELRYLLCLDEFRHFGRAAQSVGISQPALTKSLQRMEESLGARLFDRSRARVAPTVIGNEVLLRARRLVADADDLIRTVHSLAGAEKGHVSVGIGPAVAETAIAAVVTALIAHQPSAQVTLRVDHWQQLSDWLFAGEIDFYVADVGRARVDGRCEYTELAAQEFVWFCRAKHPLAGRKRRPLTRTDLLRYPIATPKLPPWAIEWFAAAFGDGGPAALPRPFPAVECESYSLLKQLVISGDFISAALHSTLARELADRSLTVLPVDAPKLRTHTGIVRLSDHNPSPLANDLIKRMLDLAK